MSDAMLDTRIGLGTMRLSIDGRPEREEAKAVIREAVERGIQLLDTADVYCLDHTDIGHGERLVAECLGEMGLRLDAGLDGAGPIVATKGGMERPEGRWVRNGHPSHLREACHASLKALGVDAVPVYQLHGPDSEVPWEESVGALDRLREEGKIRLVGISNVTVEQIEQARAVTPVACVQNAFPVQGVGYRRSPVLESCERHGLVFLAHSPFGASERARELGSHGPLVDAAAELGVGPHEAALAWLLGTSPRVVAIPGTTKPERIVGWMQAVELELSAAQRKRLANAFRTLPGHRGIVRRVLDKVRRVVTRRG